ncbi:hypothetical protein BDV93DRAFT_554091 [Ceratobasidium sp. AG-I]|nr:hypothetical protein BDV93DRAFT_554091 [Ceratobasidium sp. AG-I]
MFVLVYVDNLMLSTTGTSQMTWLKQLLVLWLNLKDLGEARQFQGLMTVQDRKGGAIRLLQQRICVMYTGAAINQFSCKQAIVTTLPTEAKYTAMEHTTKEAMWVLSQPLLRMLQECKELARTGILGGKGKQKDERVEAEY